MQGAPIEAMPGHRRGGATPQTGPRRRNPKGARGLRPLDRVTRHRRCPGIDSSSCLASNRRSLARDSTRLSPRTARGQRWKGPRPFDRESRSDRGNPVTSGEPPQTSLWLVMILGCCPVPPGLDYEPIRWLFSASAVPRCRLRCTVLDLSPLRPRPSLLQCALSATNAPPAVPGSQSAAAGARDGSR